MVTLTNQELLDLAKRQHQRRNERLLKASNGSCEINGLAMVLHELGTIWRDEASAVEEAKKRAWKTTSEQLRDAATRVIAVAQGLERYGAELGPTTGARDTVPDITPERENPSDASTNVDPTVGFLQEVGHCGVREPISGAVCTKPKHGFTSSHHGSGITWPWENEPEIVDDPFPDLGKLAMDGGWHKDDAHGVIVGIDPARLKDQAKTMIVGVVDQGKLRIMSDTPATLTIGTADAAPAWAQEPVLDIVPLSAAPDRGLPDHLSVSSLGLLAGCPLKWRLHYLHGVPRRPGWALLGGNALHTVIRHLELMPAAREAMTPETARTLFRDALDHQIAQAESDHPEFPIATWHAAQGGKEGREFWLQDGPEMIHRYLEWRKNWTAQGWELLYIGNDPIVEYEVNFVLPGTQIPLKGFIDSAWINPPARQIAVIDCKSGRSMPADHFQTSIYTAALTQVIGRTGARLLGAFWNARTGELTPLTDLHERHPLEELVYRVNTAAAQITAMAFPPNPEGGYGGCGSCDARLSCPVGSRRNLGRVQA